MTVNELAKDRINIILGYHLLTFSETIASYSYIPYQLEQLSAGEIVLSDNMKNVLSHGTAVWDYSLENIEFLRGHGIEASHLPVGYHSSLEQIDQDMDKDVDVLFFGSLGARRAGIIDRLEKNGSLRVVKLFGVYGRERDEMIARSKIVLNVHFYSAMIFEAVRVSYLMNNRCCVVSEESSVYPYSGVSVPVVPYDGIVDKCVEIIGAGKSYVEIGNATYRDFKSLYGMSGLVEKVLQ
jgi:hypothetical protein